MDNKINQNINEISNKINNHVVEVNKGLNNVKFIPNKYDLDYVGSSCQNKKCGPIQNHKMVSKQIEQYQQKAQKHCQKIKNLKKLTEQTIDLERKNEYLKLELNKLEEAQIDKNTITMETNKDIQNRL